MTDLVGQRIVITRAPHQAQDLAALLAVRGAQLLFLPLIGIAPPLDPQPLTQAAQNIAAYDWLIFTSANAVDALHAHLVSPPEAVAAHIAAIGDATAEHARHLGFHITFTPNSETKVSETLIATFRDYSLTGKRILIPAAAKNRNILPAALADQGAAVVVVEAYRTVLPPEAKATVAQIFAGPPVDWFTFASPSAVDHLLQLATSEVLGQSALASIGPATSAALRRHGLQVTVEAPTQTSAALAAAIRTIRSS